MSTVFTHLKVNIEGLNDSIMTHLKLQFSSSWINLSVKDEILQTFLHSLFWGKTHMPV